MKASCIRPRAGRPGRAPGRRLPTERFARRCAFWPG
jgi:hypothetical protein